MFTNTRPRDCAITRVQRQRTSPSTQRFPNSKAYIHRVLQVFHSVFKGFLSTNPSKYLGKTGKRYIGIYIERSITWYTVHGTWYQIWYLVLYCTRPGINLPCHNLTELPPDFLDFNQIKTRVRYGTVKILPQETRKTVLPLETANLRFFFKNWHF